MRRKFLKPDKRPMLDSLQSIYAARGEQTLEKAAYYARYDRFDTDPLGSYTGKVKKHGRLTDERPIQDADDL